MKLRPGDWLPGTHNLALLIIQAVGLYQVGYRGLDYFLSYAGTAGPSAPTSLNVVESAAPLWLWGVLFYGSALVALVGLAGRWAVPVVLAHVALFCWYGGIGYGLLQGIGVQVSWGLPLGGLLSIGGTWLVFSRRPFPLPARVFLGVPAMLVGQYLSAVDLGAGYRTGTALMASGVMHLTIGLGTFVLWQRQRMEVRLALEVEPPVSGMTPTEARAALEAESRGSHRGGVLGRRRDR